MAKVDVIIRPWLSNLLDSPESGPVTLHEEVKENTTLLELFTSISRKSKGFGDALLDETGENFSGRITVVLNGRVLGQSKELNTELKSGDNVMLFPTIEGG